MVCKIKFRTKRHAVTIVALLTKFTNMNKVAECRHWESRHVSSSRQVVKCYHWMNVLLLPFFRCSSSSYFLIWGDCVNCVRAFGTVFGQSNIPSRKANTCDQPHEFRITISFIRRMNFNCIHIVAEKKALFFRLFMCIWKVLLNDVHRKWDGFHRTRLSR